VGGSCWNRPRLIWCQRYESCLFSGAAAFRRNVVWSTCHFVNCCVANGTAGLKNVNNNFNINIYSYSETSSGQSSNLYLNVVHFFNTSVN
jgi:hypothetical protein